MGLAEAFPSCHWMAVGYASDLSPVHQSTKILNHTFSTKGRSKIAGFFFLDSPWKPHCPEKATYSPKKEDMQSPPIGLFTDINQNHLAVRRQFNFILVRMCRKQCAFLPCECSEACICIHACSHVLHPLQGNLPPPCLRGHGVSLCLDCCSRSGSPPWCTRYAALVYLSSFSLLLSFFLSIHLPHFLTPFLSVPQQSETQTVTTHRGTQAPEHPCTYSHSSTRTCIPHTLWH